MPSKDEEYQAKQRLTKNRGRRKVREAGLAYLTSEAEAMPKTTISSKYQVTLPARLVREMGLKPGDQLAVELEGLRLVLHPRPKDWVSYTAGSMPGYYGRTKEEIDEYLREVRGSWAIPLDEEEEETSESS
jgi:AbrB family looped-hinge helix DNA binding protein